MRRGELREDGRGLKEEDEAPRLRSCSIVAFRLVWRPIKEGRLPRLARAERGESEGEEALVGSGLLPGPFEAGQISNTALATSLA